MKTILVIEDDPSIRNNILKILQFKGFQTIGAENGEDGVKLAKAYLPDLILCDIMMPGIDGYGVLNALQSDSETGIPSFIFLSAKSDKSDIRQGMNLGADDYLTKPFTSTDLLDAISARLQKQDMVLQPYRDEMKRVAGNLSKVAYSDPLTDLPNRILLRHRLQEVLSQARHERSIVVVICLNLTSFQLINTTYGYTSGDALLQSVAKRLVECTTPRDVVGRLGNDEFGIVLSGLVLEEDSPDRVQTLLSAVTAPHTLDNQAVSLRATLGAALYPQHGNSPDQLLSYAETAQRWCRKQGSGSIQFYDPEMGQTDSERQVIKADLSHALERSELRMFYQPQVNLITGRMIGVEALLRWTHPNRGTIDPEIFIPIAEETELIVPIGEWVLRNACIQGREWHASHSTRLRIAVNVSGTQLRDQTFVQTVANILEETQLDPQLLTLELTETSLIKDVDATISILHKLKTMGIEIAIDDFGTGYSSLSYLHQFPIDCLKIDRTFIKQVSENTQYAEISKAIIAVAQSLKLKVIAEGVENHGQIDFLRKNGCLAIQGYIYSHPLPAPDIQELLLTDKRLMTSSTGAC
ncbi:MAG: EAL domain-containing response regulator [Elainellaceae cyanobacterium]